MSDVLSMVEAASDDLTGAGVLTPVPRLNLTDDFEGWATATVAQAVGCGALPAGEEPERLVKQLLRDIADAPFTPGFTLRFVYVQDAQVLPFELAFVQLSDPDEEALPALTDVALATTSKLVTEDFVAHGFPGREALELTMLAEDGSSTEHGTVWAMCRTVARRTFDGVGTTYVVALLASPSLAAVLRARPVLRELLTGPDLAQLLAETGAVLS